MFTNDWKKEVFTIRIEGDSMINAGIYDKDIVIVERGETANDYIVVKKEGNKTIEDKSNLVELEQYFLGLESAKIYDDICLEFTKMTFPELLVDIGIDYNSVEAVQDFTLKLSTAITNQQKTPSQK